MTDGGEAFSARLRVLRAQTGWSLARVGRDLAAHGGQPVSGEAVRQWEQGVNTPRRDQVAALEGLYGVPGELADLLGYRPADPGLADRLSALEDRMDEMAAAFIELRDEFAESRRRDV